VNVWVDVKYLGRFIKRLERVFKKETSRTQNTSHSKKGMRR
jgi:hypothetical protein